MEYALWCLAAGTVTAEAVAVLILVLMEYALWYINKVIDTVDGDES